MTDVSAPLLELMSTEKGGRAHECLKGLVQKGSPMGVAP